ncbi:baculoviral IAP repeat-containing protein 3-like isoform X1 [Biomphalaria glabrata]|uniref:Baculoviral IAP repeat-containing protein 3-like isoform X1 n=1 Tax=Biomphalaria glabrata TaxID=6526 RepID=A0A9W2Z3A2_BIOGL|nr:baculoviral IAP repeat-containing protein 3-like isoform X1 [Biomphalaria glabrata]XP_055869476.1 baculoviral IAP repeat-containing protein 3-like isoform X1 [Biomphalaria glabrata]XP_055869477.1 baculoviral IAP repeat-containing protein 3-like isoform X1 [Biomphalaria glabrata]
MASNHHPNHVNGIAWVNFERETLRAASFLNYPSRAVKPSTLLTESGFVYIGNGKSDKVICYFCYFMKENWKEEEEIHVEHKRASPHCPMVTILESNNVASIALAENVTPVHSFNHLQGNVNRASDNFQISDNRNGSGNTSIPPPQFVTASSSDVHNTMLGTATYPIPPLLLNRNISRSPVNQNLDSTRQHPNINSQIYSIPRMPLSVPPNNSDTHDSSSGELNLQNLGIFYERPKKPEFAILAKREESFEGWPSDCPVSKEKVAKAGIYYEGYGDSGKCFFCGGGLRKWEQDDDPFIEHARWYPKCGYIRQYMGQKFVDVVQKIKLENSNRVTREQVLEKMHKDDIAITNESPIENDPAVKSVLDEFRESQIFSKDEIIKVSKTLRKEGVTLSADEIFAKLSNKSTHVKPTPMTGATAVGATNIKEDDIVHLREENTTLRNNLICKICMDKEVRIVFLPCGHLVSCQECSVAFVDCPICRSHIRAYVRASIK